MVSLRAERVAGETAGPDGDNGGETRLHPAREFRVVDCPLANVAVEGRDPDHGPGAGHQRHRGSKGRISRPDEERGDSGGRRITDASALRHSLHIQVGQPLQLARVRLACEVDEVRTSLGERHYRERVVADTIAAYRRNGDGSGATVPEPLFMRIRAAAAGASERAIMNQTGHWSLTMVRRYIREGGLFRENAAATVGL